MPLSVYNPVVKLADIYFAHPAAQPLLLYNHDVDIVYFKGRYLAAWNANEHTGENVPGQYNYLSISTDFENWSAPVRLFTAEAGCENPVESDNQWQPTFINWHDETLFCAWCDFNDRRTFVATSKDGIHWSNQEVPTAPPALAGQVVGFPTNHGLLTSRDVMMFSCSLPPAKEKFIVGETRYSGVLISTDGGRSWEWSEPVAAANWSECGENPDEFGGEEVFTWEPMLFEQADGRIGLLVRNSTAQDAPERTEKPHRMLLYATSADHGRTWSKARPVEVDTICSRNFTVAGVGNSDGMVMVMNDHNVRVPERISRDRYFLSLYCAPVCAPDLLLPGPLVQPEGGTAFYPNGFLKDGRLHVAYTYPRGIHCAIVDPLPDYSQPFLLPRAGRSGLRIDEGMALFSHKQSSLGLVLTAALTRKPQLRLAFDIEVHRYDGTAFPLLTLGGKTRQGTVLRARFSETEQKDVLEVKDETGGWVSAGPLPMKTWHHIEIDMEPARFSVSVDGGAALPVNIPLLRKICFGGLYEPPQWPQGMERAMDIRLRLDSIVVG